MAGEPPTNGASSVNSDNMSAAEKLRAKHEANAAHNPIVEEVVDEEDIQHPPPSVQAAQKELSEPILDVAAELLSEKAAGKRKADPGSATGPVNAKGDIPLNTQSEEAFPALGSGPKPATQAPAAMAWGAKKPSTVHAGTNGTNGHTPSLASSRTSTPTSGVLTPSTTNASVNLPSRGLSFPQNQAIPGKHVEEIPFAPSQLLPRNQLKKPLQEILRGINKSSKAKVEMRTAANGNVIFKGAGPVDATRQALKDLAKEVGSKQQVKVPIPMSVRPHIIGRQGAVIQGISKRTGARVQIPKAEESPAPAGDGDDDSQEIDVTIEGDAVAAEMARREIADIVAARTSTASLRLRDIPAELFPFIAGPYNSGISALEDGREIRVQVPHYHTWTDQPPPQQPAAGSNPQFVPSANQHIRISGDREEAQKAKAEIEQLAQELCRQITLSQVPIDRNRHQFILENENSLHDLLQETGCAIIMPPASDDTEFLTITGPHDRIEIGLEKVMDLASAMQSSRINVAKQHPNAPMGAQAHARALSQYLQQRRAIEQLEKQHNARIVLPSDIQGSPDWDLYFKDGKNGIRARQDILNLINAHPPQRLRHVEMDPFFHQHVHQQGARQVRDDYGVHLVTPSRADPGQHLILVYEGPPSGEAQSYQVPTQRPSLQEIAEFEKSLQQAQEHLLSLIAGQQDIGAADIDVPLKYHDKVRKFVGREQEHLPASQIPIQLNFGPTNVAGGGLPAPQKPGQLRGPSNALEDFTAKILAFVEAEKRDEVERGHITTFDYPQKYANFLIGKRGENINKYREEFDVDIQVKDGKVIITGPKAKAGAAKSKILALLKKLEDESTHVLKIDPKFHRELVGAKGAQVNRLQDRYMVRVQFPRHTPAVGDDASVADDASEVGSVRNRRPNQAPDEVIVRGPSRGADAARDELLSLLQWTKDNSHSSTVSVAQRQLPSLIGQGGQELESIQLATGAKIDVPGRDSVDASGRVQIQIKGTKKAVEDAKKTIEQKAKVFDDSILRIVNVDRKHHSAIIGSGGSNIRNIVVTAGGSDDRRDLARTVRFPKQDSPDNGIRVEGNKALVDKIVAAIEAIGAQKEGQTTEIIEVAPEKHRLLIGKGGESRRALESQFSIGLDIPKQTVEGPERSHVKVTGQPEDIKKAKTHIMQLTRDQEGETIQVPRKYHHAVSDNGQLFRRLRNDHKIVVEHGSHKPPPKPTAASSASKPNGGASKPLITVDQNDAHSWDIVDNANGAASEEGDIPWILRGNAENLVKARSVLEKALEQAKSRESESTGFLILPDPKTYRFIIGQGGSQINAIRKQTGCKITVPRDQVPGSAIEIVGNKDGVEEARDIILDVVQNGGRRD